MANNLERGGTSLFENEILMVANPVKNLRQVLNPLTVIDPTSIRSEIEHLARQVGEAVHAHHLPDLQQTRDSLMALLSHPETVDEVKAEELITGLIRDSLSAGKPIVIEDGSHGFVFGIRSLTVRKIEVIKINRFGEKQEVKEIVSPRFIGKFTNTKRGKEFSLEICAGGRAPIARGRKRARLEEDHNVVPIITISSDGNLSPRPFIVSTGSWNNTEVLFARKDVNNALTCSWEYKGETKWIVSGKEKVKTSRKSRGRSSGSLL